MSHFSVLVVTKKGTDAQVNKALAPYNEQDNNYMLPVSRLEQAKADYEKDTCRRYKMLDGTLVSPYGKEFYRRPTDEERALIKQDFLSNSVNGHSYSRDDLNDGLGHDIVVKTIPEDSPDLLWLPYKDVMTFDEFVDYQYEESTRLEPGDKPDPDDYSWIQLDADGKVVDIFSRTNPNGHWDWFSVGGSWTGFFEAGYEAHQDPANHEICFLCHGTGKRNDQVGRDIRAKNPAYGCNGCDSTGHKLKHAGEWRPVGNTVQRKALDVEMLQRAAAQKAQLKFDRLTAVVKGMPLAKTWDQVKADIGLDPDMQVVRDAFYAQPMAKALSDTREFGFGAHEWVEVLHEGREAFVEHEADNALRTFAVVKDGTWSQRGKMGWWCNVRGEAAPETWQAQFDAIFASVKPDEYLTIVDCHV